VLALSERWPGSDELELYLQQMATERGRFSISKIIHKASDLTLELKAWAEKEFDKQFSGTGAESGLDITTSEVISVPHAIYQVLKTY
jgi:hypothetical protein